MNANSSHFGRGRAALVLSTLMVGVVALGSRVSTNTKPIATGTTTPAWVCPMNDGGSAEKSGPCPRCGMALVAAATQPPPLAAEGPARVAAFVCSKGDGTEGVEAGRCPKCGAEMVEATRPLTTAILVFDGVQIIDYCGPFEVFGRGGCQPFTVAKSAPSVTTAMGMKVVPQHTFADCPPVDIIVVPGGSVDAMEADAEAIAWLRERGQSAQFVLSVCNGAFILARTGLIDGLTATTFYDLIDEFETRYPKVKAVRDRRYVDNGKFVTTAGISSGIDGALHVIEKLRGHATAQKVALNMEYDWKPTADYARAAFADAPLRRIFERSLQLRIVDGVGPLLVRTQGDARQWDVEWRVVTPLTASELLSRLDRTLEERGPWTRVTNASAAALGNAAPASTWRFDHAGTGWKGITEVAPEQAARHYRVRVRVEQVVNEGSATVPAGDAHERNALAAPTRSGPAR